MRALLLVSLLVGCSAGSPRDADPTPTLPAEDSGADSAPPVSGGDGGGLSGETFTPTNDHDGDGYEVGDDCDDGNKEINPGAIEVPGDGVDNDCDGKVDVVEPECDTGLALASTDALDFARALGLCRQATKDSKGKARTWGVLAARLTTTDGVAVPLPRQHGIEKGFGDNVKPPAGESMVVLSSGVARTPGQPDFMALPKGVDSTTHASAPPDGWPRNTKGCPASKTKMAFDSVVLELDIRVPTNAKGFSYDFDFYTSEYVEYVCQAYNDTFVALLKTKVPLSPAANGNVSFDADGDPINVNSGFFQVCSPDSWLGRKFDCPLGTSELAGTGFDAVATSLTKPAQNGATSWLRTTQEVVPGEEITIRFAIWNTGDHWLPSTVLLDRWTWRAEPTTASKTDRPR
ncbi:MAG: choice-of-anchor L domain-containing protein [Polyangiales bacterium]